MNIGCSSDSPHPSRFRTMKVKEREGVSAVKTHRGGEQVTRGIYWSLASGEFFQSPSQGTVLPGGPDRRYLWMPAPVVLVLVPLIGLVYIMFLPLVGIVGLLTFVGHRLTRRGLQVAAEVAVPTWVPGVSFLVRGRRGKGQRPTTARETPPEEMEEFMGELEQELQERRRKGEK